MRASAPAAGPFVGPAVFFAGIFIPIRTEAVHPPALIRRDQCRENLNGSITRTATGWPFVSAGLNTQRRAASSAA